MTRTEQLCWAAVVVLLLMFMLGALEQMNYRLTQVRSFTVYVTEPEKKEII